MADWSQLPYDIIQMIAIHLDAVEDFIAFSAVCQSWRSFYLAKQWIPGSQVPWLMLSDNGNNKRTFFSLYKDREYELELPEARGRRCWGSCDGWLVTLGRDFAIHLLNAFTRVHIRLPDHSSFFQFDVLRNWYDFIDKAIVIKKPRQRPISNEDLWVMTIYGPFNQLAFTQPGYDSWIMVEESSRYSFIDVAYFNGQIYGLCGVGTLVLVEINSKPPRVEFIAPPPHQLAWEKLFLVESSGALLMVCQYIYVNPYDPLAETLQFEVHRFDFDAKKWKRLEDLGDRALFIGDNSCVSVAASKFANCRVNSIYFVGSKVEDFWAIDGSLEQPGVYDMANGIIEPFFFGADYPSYYSCPIWVIPSLCGGH